MMQWVRLQDVVGDGRILIAMASNLLAMASTALVWTVSSDKLSFAAR